MTENSNQPKPVLPHNLIMENREKLTVSGVIKVENFDDTSVVMLTQMGEMSVKGSQLHISKMDVDTGDLKITGKFFGLVYNDNVSNGSVFSKLFK